MNIEQLAALFFITSISYTCFAVFRDIKHLNQKKVLDSYVSRLTERDETVKALTDLATRQQGQLAKLRESLKTLGLKDKQ